MESSLRAPEEVFVILTFAAPTRTGRRGGRDIVLAAIFVVFIFAEADYPQKLRNFAPREKFSLYGVPIVWFMYIVAEFVLYVKHRGMQ